MTDLLLSVHKSSKNCSVPKEKVKMKSLVFVRELAGSFNGSVVKNPRLRRHGFDPWVGNISLEKGMAAQSSILAWKIPWTEEPGGL